MISKAYFEKLQRYFHSAELNNLCLKNFFLSFGAWLTQSLQARPTFLGIPSVCVNRATQRNEWEREIPAVNGTVFVFGDMHGNWIRDVVEDDQTALLNQYQVAPPVPTLRQGTSPENIAAGFQRAATANLPRLNLRAASAAVEFAPSSMGRGGEPMKL